MRDTAAIVLLTGSLLSISFSKTFDIPFSSGKISGEVDLFSGLNSIDTLVFGGKDTLSTYKAISIVTSCGTEGELGLKTIRTANNLVMKSTEDTNWNNSQEVPIQPIPIGSIPTRKDYVIEFGNTSPFPGFSFAHFIGSCGQAQTYDLSKGYNRIGYFISDSYAVKFQINGYQDYPIPSLPPVTYGKGLQTVRVRYVISDDKKDLKENPIGIRQITLKITHKRKNTSQAFNLLGVRRQNINNH